MAGEFRPGDRIDGRRGPGQRHARVLDRRRDGRHRGRREARRAGRAHGAGVGAPARRPARSTCRRPTASARTASSSIEPCPARISATMRFDDVVERLERACPSSLPAPAEVLMPVIVGGRDLRPPRTPPPGRPGRPAAVLVLLYPDDDGDGPRRPDRAGQPRRAPQRRGQLPGRQGRTRGRRPGRDRPARGGRGGRARRRPRPGSGWSACSNGSGSRSATSRSRRSSPSPRGRPALVAAPAEVARIVEPPMARFLPGRPDRHRRAADRRVAAALRRLRGRRPVRLGRHGPHPQPARGRSCADVLTAGLPDGRPGRPVS